MPFGGMEWMDGWMVYIWAGHVKGGSGGFVPLVLRRWEVRLPICFSRFGVPFGRFFFCE